jgi:hypothetical protein
MADPVTDPAAAEAQIYENAFGMQPASVATGGSPAADAASGQPSYKPLFNYDDAQQLDRDTYGSATRALGAARGLAYDEDTILELNVMGEAVPIERLLEMEGGRELAELARKKRKGRRGFMEALTNGGLNAEMLPFAGDLVAAGVAIRNMEKVRDSFTKISKGEELSLQEKVLAKLYLEDSERSSKQTFGGMVGGIVRQAPAFAAEFALTGGLFKAGTKLVGMAAKEGVEQAVEKTVGRRMAVAMADEMRKPLMTRAGIDISKMGLETLADDAVKAALEVSGDVAEGAALDALKATAIKSATAYATAYKNPSIARATGNFLAEYSKRGVFDHLDEVVRDLPPTMLGKLREAAGVALIEAPLKGGMYAAFDFLVANPVVAAAAGANEAVTRTELGLYATGREDLMRNAKMLAFGTAWAEYASETSGRAFNALGGIVTENIAGKVARNVARSGLRARADFVNEGSAASQLFTALEGTGPALKKTLSQLKQESIESAVKNAHPLTVGKSVGEILADKDTANKIIRETLGFREKSFLGHWMANKALDLDVTPQRVVKWMENAGYDEILGEFMEERYNGFAQGLFGLDGAPDEGFMGNLARAAKESIPTFTQGAAEILAFAIPTVGRALTMRAYEALGASDTGKFKEVNAGVTDLEAVGGMITDVGGKITATDIRTADEGSGSAAREFREKAGKASVEDKNLWKLRRFSSIVDNLVDSVRSYDAMREDTLGVGVKVARTALGIIQAAMTGNFRMAFHNPLRALAAQSAGGTGNILLAAASGFRRKLYRSEVARRAGMTEADIEAGRVPGLVESRFDDPAVDEAIRPLMVEKMSAVVKDVLRSRGTVIVTDSDVDRFVAARFSGDGDIAGMSREAFKDKFYTELAEGAAGRMTFDIVNGQARAVYNKPEISTMSEVAKAAELFLNTQGVQTFLDAGTLSSVSAVHRSQSGVPMSQKLFRQAAGEPGSGTDAEIEAARMRLVHEVMAGSPLGSEDGIKTAMSHVAEYASVVLELNRRLLRPSYDAADGTRYEVSGSGTSYSITDGLTGARLAGTSTYATQAEAEAAAAAIPGLTGREAEIFFTASNTVYAPLASMLLSRELPGSREYVKKHAGISDGDAGTPNANPFFFAPADEPFQTTHKRVREQVELARRWLDRNNAQFATEAEEQAGRDAYLAALADTADGDAADGYETAARKAAEKAGIKRYGKPDARGQRGYIFAPAAISYGGALYIPYSHAGSLTGFIEDASETAIKRDPTVFRLPNGEYRPAAKAFILAVGSDLLSLAATLPSDSPIRKEAEFLHGMFDPNSQDRGDVEALSHAITAFSFFQGDYANKQNGIGGSAYYRTLGLVARQVRARTEVYYGFNSLVNRLAGGGLLDGSENVLSGMTAKLVPRRFLDDAASVRDAVGGATGDVPVADVARAGESLTEALEIARAGIPRSGVRAYDLLDLAPEARAAMAEQEQAFYKARLQSLEAGGDYLPEDLPFVLDELAGRRDAAMREAGVGSDAVLAWEASELGVPFVPAPKSQAIGEPGEPEAKASMAEDALLKYPAYAIEYAEEAIRRGQVPAAQPGDQRPRIRRVFDAWRHLDPLLPEGVFARFEAAAEAAGLLKKPAGKAGIAKAFADAEASGVGLTDDGDAGHRAEEASDGTSQYDAEAGARLLESSPEATMIRLGMELKAPAAQHSKQKALQMFRRVSASLYRTGLADTDSLGSLFFEDAWTDGLMHPALADEATWALWISKPRPEDKLPLFEGLLTTLRIMPLESVFAGLDKMKGSWGRAILDVTADVGADGKATAVMIKPRTQSGSPEVSENLLRAAKAFRSKADYAGARAALNAEATLGYEGRLERLSAVADMVFGPENDISQRFRDPAVQRLTDRLTGRAEGSKAESVFTAHFVEHTARGGTKLGAGLMAVRMLNAVKLLEEGKDGEAMRELLRGDALYFGRLSDRGGVNTVFNRMASVIAVDSASRRGEGNGRVRGVEPALSAGQKRFLHSAEFEAAFIAAGGAKAELQQARANAEWADGTKVFAAVSGLTRRSPAEAEGETESEVIGEPRYEEVDALMRKHFEGSDAVVNIALYNGEKAMERLVRVPRAALAALAGKEAPSYEELRQKLSKWHMISEVAAKRMAVSQAHGPAALLRTAKMAVVLPADGSNPEGLHGMAYVGDPVLGAYLRRQGFADSAKFVGTNSPTDPGYAFFTKGQYILADEDSKARGAGAELAKLAREGGYAVLTDLDSYKESALLFKGADGRTLLAMAIAGAYEGDVQTPDGPRPAAEVAAELGVKVTAKTVNGKKANVVEFSHPLRVQWASSPAKPATPKHNPVPINHVLDNPQAWPFYNAQVKARLALAKRPGMVASAIARVYAKLPESVLALIRAGTPPQDPGIAEILGPKLASELSAAFSPVEYGVTYLNRNHAGARVAESAPGVPERDAEGKVVVADPYGGMVHPDGVPIHDSQALTAEESAAMGGAKRRLASTTANAGGATFRYGLRADAAKFDAKTPEGIEAEIALRVKSLYTAMLRSFEAGDPAIYVQSYLDNIEGRFTDHAGRPLQPGQMLSFADLVTIENGMPVFDATRVRRSTSAMGEGFIFLGGEVEISGRIPSGDGRRAEYAYSVAAPATEIEADGVTHRYMGVYRQPDGTLSARAFFYPKGTLIPGTTAVLNLTPEAKHLAGSDEDWDKSPSRRMPRDKFGREMPAVKDAEAAIASAETDDAAQKLADAAVQAAESAAYRVAVAIHRTFDAPVTGVTASPFTQEQEASLPKAAKTRLDTPEALAKASRDKDVGSVLRGIAVKVAGDIRAAIDIGLRFGTPVAGGKQILRKPAGAKSPYWEAGFRAGTDPVWDKARLDTYTDAASGIKNSTYDYMKGELATRAGFLPEHLDLYLYLLSESGVRSQEAYWGFHQAWMEWVAGPDGQAVTQGFYNGQYPGGYGGLALRDALKVGGTVDRDLRDAAKKEGQRKGAPVFFRVYGSLSFPHKALVRSLVRAAGGGEAGYIKSFPAVEALSRLGMISKTAATLAYKKAEIAFPEKIAAVQGATATAYALLDTENSGAEFTATGREALEDAASLAVELRRAGQRALAGNPALSGLVADAMESAPPKGLKAATGGLRPRDAAVLAAGRRVGFDAAVLMTPADTGAKIDAIAANAQTPAEGTAEFLAATESVIAELFADYAADRKGAPNAALDTLLGPGTQSLADKIMMTGSDNGMAAAPALQEGMLRLRDWTPGSSQLKPVTVFKKGWRLADGSVHPPLNIKVTPRDAYWMLLQYSLLTSGKSVETTRASQSLVRAFFGDDVYRQIGEYQTLALEGQEQGSGSDLLKFTRSSTRDYGDKEVRKTPLTAIPDVFGEGSEARKWGGYDAELASLRATIEMRTGRSEASAAMLEQGAKDPAPTAEKPVKTVEADAPAAAAASAAGFKGYRGGFENAGKGTPAGDGKDKAMRKAMTSAKVPGFIGEIANVEKGSSTRTSLLEAASYGSGGNATKTAGTTHSSLPMFMASGKYAEGELVVMLARNGEFNGRPLAAATDAAVRAAHKAGASFVVGDMPGVDSQFVDLLSELGAPFEIYHTGASPRLTVGAAAAPVASQAAPVLQSPASAALQNFRFQAARAASADASRRLLPSLAHFGPRLTAKMTDAHAAGAAASAKALRGLAELPWLSGVPSAADTLDAAARIMLAMRYAEPAVLQGAVLALGRAAADAKAEDAYAPLKQLFTEAGIANTLDTDRLTAVRDSAAETARVLAAPAAQRVMEFAVIAEGRFAASEKGVPAEAVAKKLLSQLNLGESASASRAEEPVLDTNVGLLKANVETHAELAKWQAALDSAKSDEEAYRAEAAIKGLRFVLAQRGHTMKAREKAGIGDYSLALPAGFEPLVRGEFAAAGKPVYTYDPDADERASASLAFEPAVVPAVEMPAADRALVPAMMESAVGYTPDRSGDATMSMAGEAYADAFADIARRAQAEIDGLTRDEAFDGYSKKFYTDKFQRKRIIKPDSVAARVPLYLGNDPKARQSIRDYALEQLEILDGVNGLGSAKALLRNAVGMYFETSDKTRLRDVALMNGREFGELMARAGNAQAHAVEALASRRLAAEKLAGPARDAALAELAKADSAFFSTLHLLRSAAVALRPMVNGHANPLRAAIAALEGQKLDKPPHVPVPPPPTGDGVSPLDPDTGHPDPLDDFHMSFISSDAWFYGTVFPDFMGSDLRGLLLDKEALAAVPQAYAAANMSDAYLGVNNDTGVLQTLVRAKGLGHHLEAGGYVHDKGSAADITVMGRRKLLRDQAAIASGDAFSDSEFALARWFGNAVWHYMGDGGLKARQAISGEVRLDLPWRDGPEKLAALISLAEAQRRLGNPDPESRIYDVQRLLLRAKEVLPEELYQPAEDAVREAVAAGARAMPGREAQAALIALEKAGFAVARRRETKDESGAVTGETLYDVRLAIPVSLTERIFRSGSAFRKLLKHGRLDADLTLEAMAKPLQGAFDKTVKSVQSLGWASDGDSRLFSDNHLRAPMFKGAGAWQYYARRLDKPLPPEYRAAVRKAADSLQSMFSAMKVEERTLGENGEAETEERWVTGAEASANPRFARMFAMLADLRPGTFAKDSSAADAWAVIVSGRARGLGLDASSTAWDIAKAVHSASVVKLHDSAWAGGTVEAAEASAYDGFAAAVETAAEALGADSGRRGSTFSEVYNLTGALPQNMTAGEAVAAHARETAEAMRYRMAVNQMLMTRGEDGKPLVYAKPGANVRDDTVPDNVWGMIARWWVASHSGPDGGLSYDEAATGRENARRLYDQIVPQIQGSGSETGVIRGERRLLLTDVEIPDGMMTFEAVAAMKDPAGDDTRARMNVFGGGEAANVVRQIFQVAGYGRPDARLAGMNRALSWSKSASVMASFFFPIATAFESPIAAVGTWPTLLGLTKSGSDFARWMSENQGWIAKAAGVKDIAQAPFMADILRVIGSDDPALVDLKVHAILSGISLADRARNMMDTDRAVIAQDIKAMTAQVRATLGSKAARSAKALLEGAMEHSSEFAFEYVINATKIAVFAQMNNRMRQRALAAGRWWDPVRDMKKWAPYVNAEVGGIDPAMYPWMTPKMQQVLKATMFSWEWTLGAWEAGGGGVLTQKMFGYTTNEATRKFMLGRWIRMYGSVMIGLPVAMQLLVTGIAKAAGDGDDDDKWLSARNEKGRQWKDFDITPLLRTIANHHLLFLPSMPTVGDIKRKLPGSVWGLPVGDLLPGLTGQEGEMVSTGKRRYYMHFGKQGWEVAGWFENPTKSFLSKMSMPAQKILEGVLGITPSMGWEKPFAETGFWERWTSLDGDKSAALNLLSAFQPFSAAGIVRAPEAGLFSAFGPVGKGMSKTRAEKEMAAMFMAWGDADTFAAQRMGKPGAWTDTASMAVEWLEALRLNGYPPETSLKNALTAARKPLYEKIHKALPAFAGGKADERALEEAARGMYRLDFVAKNLMASLKAKDKARHIERTGDLGKISDAALWDAFTNPYGPAKDPRLARSADRGGDVTAFLASDKVPAKILGYKVLRTEELSDDDLAFFEANPDSAGHFDMGGKGGEVAGIALGRRVAPETYRKADASAARRAAEGKPVWARPGEAKPLAPGFVDMLKSAQPKGPR